MEDRKRVVGGLGRLTACGLAILGLAQGAVLLPDAAVLQASVERTVDAYVLAAAELGRNAGSPPEILVANTPQLSYYSPQTNRIVIPYWPPQESTVAFFLALTDGDEALARELFVELFDWFLVAHELTHWLMTARGVETDHYTSEAMANDGAVAFYNLFPESEERFLRLDALLAAALERLADPTPGSLDPVTYFNAFYPALTGNPRQYGYFQFRFIRDSIARRQELEFASFVAALPPIGAVTTP
ncbi:MAG: hypothetical protein PHW86_03195 [Candidatus Bipolaricaulis sp.]|nr:hypothetical protein [Candidatus Bipolaricaulis sp.]